MKRITIFVSVFVFLYSAFAVSEYFLVSQISEKQKETKRLANIREYRAGVRDLVVGQMAGHAKDIQPEVLILGDSQTYGHRMPPEMTLGRYIEDLSGMVALNFSIVDGRHVDFRRIVDLLSLNGVRAKYLVMNANPSHAREYEGACRHFCDDSFFPISSATGLVDLIYSDVHGVLYSDRNSFSEKKREDYYIGLMSEEYASGLLSFLEHAEQSGVFEQALVFVSPNLSELFAAPPYSYRFNIDEFVEEVLNACESNTFAKCVDLSKLTSKDMHFDIVHLNSSGMERLAREIVSQLP